MLAYNFFTDDEKKKIAEAIRAAELDTSGEVRVHVEGHCKEDALDCAAYWFGKLGMHKTELRNGVLFYLAVNDHKFAILGDAGINSKVPEDFWEKIKDHMRAKFKEGLFADGLAEGILMAGEQLKAHFPYQKNDQNELSDDLSFG
ncbi:MAG: TPM domain-containing protein [Prolixibacteraceae bacterium]